MVVEVGHSGVQAQEFLSAFPSSEPLLTSLLTPCGTVGLLHNGVAARRGNHLLVIDALQARTLSDRRRVAPQLISMDNLWNVILTQEASREGLCRSSVPMPLKEDVEHEALLVDRSPEPVSNTIDACTHLVQKPPRTPTGFPVAQFLSEEGAEFYAPLAEGLVADLLGRAGRAIPGHPGS